MRPLVRTLLAVLCALSATPLLARAQVLPTGFADQILASGFDQAVALEFTPDGRVLIAEQQSGRVRLVQGTTILADIFTVDSLSTTGERGLLGVALDPQFPQRPYLYTHETVVQQRIQIARWTLTGDLAGTGSGQLSVDPASRFLLLGELPDTASNHNGGTVRFGPDGDLYVSLGEDADDCAAQDPAKLKGKILRLAVNTLPAGPGRATLAQITPADNPFAAAADPNQRLVCAYGLRNPFRIQVDPVRRWLVIADVGQNTFEEMDLLALPGGQSGAPAMGGDYGWPWLEGTASYQSCSGSLPATVAPIFVLDRTALGSAAIISAGAYHRVLGGIHDWPATYEGDVFFSEYYSGNLWRLQQQPGGTWAIAPAEPGQADARYWGSGLSAPTDFRVGPDGALWYLSAWSGNFDDTGSLHRIASTDTSASAGGGGAAVRFSARPLPALVPVTLSYDLPTTQVTALRLYDVRGRMVRELSPPHAQTPAHYDVTWNGADDAGRRLPAGVYWARLDAGSQSHTLKLPFVR